MAAAMQHEDQELVEQALAEGGMEGLALLLGGDKAPLASGGDFDFVDTEAGSTTGYAPVYKLEDGSRVAIAQSVTYDLRDPRLAAFNPAPGHCFFSFAASQSVARVRRPWK